MSRDLIEEGWQEFVSRMMPEPPPADVAPALRCIFFAGARRYREIIRSTFMMEGGTQTLMNLTLELDREEGG